MSGIMSEIIKAVCEYADKYRMLDGCNMLLCAVSGGADSMCLLHMMQRISCQYGFALAAAHFNHRLRGEHSDFDEAFVSKYCEISGIKLIVGSEDVAAYAAANKTGIEESARELRYAFFESAAAGLGADKIATAHNADDNAETMILNLLRGSGLRGLSGIPPVRGNYIRPLLCLDRKRIITYLIENGVEHTEDLTNGEPICSRNIIRKEVIPVLRSMNPDFAAAAGRCAESLRADDAYMEKQASEFPREYINNGEKISVRTDALSAFPDSIASRVIRDISEEFNILLSQPHVAAVLKICGAKSPSASVNLPKGLTVSREYEKLIFSLGNVKEDGFTERELTYDRWTPVPEIGLEFFWGNAGKINTQFNIFFFKKEAVCGKIIVRPRKTGDKIRLSVNSGTKTLKKLFIEKKIPAAERSRVPVISDDIGVLAVYGIGADYQRLSISEKDYALASRPVQTHGEKTEGTAQRAVR